MYSIRLIRKQNTTTHIEITFDLTLTIRLDTGSCYKKYPQLTLTFHKCGSTIRSFIMSKEKKRATYVILLSCISFYLAFLPQIFIYWREISKNSLELRTIEYDVFFIKSCILFLFLPDTKRRGLLILKSLLCVCQWHRAPKLVD